MGKCAKNILGSEVLVGNCSTKERKFWGSAVKVNRNEEGERWQDAFCAGRISLKGSQGCAAVVTTIAASIAVPTSPIMLLASATTATREGASSAATLSLSE